MHILSGYVKVYCPVGDGNPTLVRLAGPGEIIGYSDYLDEKGRNARLFEVQVASKCTWRYSTAIMWRGFCQTFRRRI